MSRSSSQLTWNITSLATNAGSQLALTFRATALGVLTNTGIVLTSTQDPNPDDNTAAVAVSVGTTQLPQVSGNSIKPGGAFALTVSAPVNPPLSTIIQASTNLVNWVNVYTNMPPFVFTDPHASNYRTRFYRAVLGP